MTCAQRRARDQVATYLPHNDLVAIFKCPKCICVCKTVHLQHTYIHTYMHTCIHTYLPTYLHTYIHTYIHACIHTYTVLNIEPHTVLHCVSQETHFNNCGIPMDGNGNTVLIISLDTGSVKLTDLKPLYDGTAVAKIVINDVHCLRVARSPPHGSKFANTHGHPTTWIMSATEADSQLFA